jgi:acyl carrier protein phosphodiesterase
LNFLFHMYLSGDDQELLVGNFMGDFVKGPLGEDYPPGIREGLMLHRKIDSFAQGNRDFQTSRLRLSPGFGLYRGVLVDLFYDHFLAKEWDSWSDTPFQEYISSARSAVEKHLAIMPKLLQESVPVIFNELLPSYKSIAGTEAALGRMSRRIKRSNPLAEGGLELSRHYEELKADFERFTPTALLFAADFISDKRPE